MKLVNLLNEALTAFTEVPLSEAKPKFEVKYAAGRKGKIQVAKFMTLNGAKKFLKDIEKSGSKGIISVNGKPIDMAKQMKLPLGEELPLYSDYAKQHKEK